MAALVIHRDLFSKKREFLPVTLLQKENQLGLKPLGLTLQSQPHVSSLKSHEILGIMGMEMPFVKEKNHINLSVFQKIKSQSKTQSTGKRSEEKKSRLKGKEILDENILF